MTLPIAFTPTPHDASTDNADAADAFGQVATVTAANFAKINTHLAARRPTFGWTVLTGAVTYTTDLAWHDYPGEAWAPLILAVPSKPAHMLISIGASVDVYIPSTSMAISFRVSGAGAYTHDVRMTVVGCRNGLVAHSRSAIIPASYLTPGTSVTITPQYQVGTTEGAIALATLNGIALV